MKSDALVEIRDLKVAFDGRSALHGVDLTIGRGEALGLVGESGCGKSITWLAALGLLPRSASASGSVLLEGRNILNAPARDLEKIRGRRIAMIFQDPASALNPVLRIGRQIGEALTLHQGLSGSAIKAEARRLLELVGIPDAVRRLDAYPHEMSGGQNQRVMIAMALAGKPDLLVADEPTTALDATIQAQILDLLATVRRETNMALVLISHDLGAVSEICERVAVMYAGRVVEEADAVDLFAEPRHPYTIGLLGALPSIAGPRRRLDPIPGAVPEPWKLAHGCAFAPRCARRQPQCAISQPAFVTVGYGRRAACPVIAPQESERRREAA